MKEKKKELQYYMQRTLIVFFLLCGINNIVYAQENREKTIDVSGSVKDDTGETLPGCAVYVKGNPLFGAVTDMDGNFSMNNIPAKSILVFTYIGYKETEVVLSKIPTGDLKRIRVVMQESESAIEEVVVTATGAQKKVSVVGAITAVNPTELKSPTRSLSTQLAGRVAGVTFTQSSGQPGKDGASFIIRGINSLTGSTSPLILIDGLKRTIDDVDANDIESFQS
jgi:Outer membrane cobalamin receptor protein